MHYSLYTLLYRPFFFTTLPGAAEANGAIAKQVRRDFKVCILCSYFVNICLISIFINQEFLHSQNHGNIWKILDSNPCWWSSEAFPFWTCNLESHQSLWTSYALNRNNKSIHTGIYSGQQLNLLSVNVS